VQPQTPATGTMRQTWRIRAMLLGFGVVFMLASYLLFIPKMPPRQGDRVSSLVPVCVLGGLLLGIAVLIVDRRYPRLFRYTPSSLKLASFGLLGLLMAISEAALVLVAAVATGVVLLVATPYMRFPAPAAKPKDPVSN
jgi:MFS superfamily sulfate permease-like transporter